MSTMWYARHAATVVSIENYRVWHDVVSPRIAALGNVDYRLAEDRAAYTALVPAGQFDLIMIDGSHREDCAKLAITRLAEGGVIYLDNSDKGLDARTGDVPEARRILLAFAQNEGLPTCEFTDFAPTQLHVQRGLWIGPMP
jgi:predicted O-methyltransferase YrrM